MSRKLKIIIIGTGNVAHHLGLALLESEQEIIQLIGRNKENTSSLAKILDVEFSTDIKTIKQNADLVILAVSDNAISEIANNNNFGNALVVHTSGSVSVDELKNLANRGVFYPLQTFSKNREIDFSEVPIFIEANSSENLSLLEKLAKKISTKVEHADSEKRKALHLAAVFACNFSNQMYAIAEKLLVENDLKFDYLEALINETAKKAIEKGPRKAQTGPALRNDKIIIDKHLQMLSEHDEIQKIYTFVSKSISEFKNS